MDELLVRAKTNEGESVEGYYYLARNGVENMHFVDIGNTVSKRIVQSTIQRCTGIYSDEDSVQNIEKALIFEGDTVSVEPNGPGRVETIKGTVVWQEGAWMVDDGTNSVYLWQECGYVFLEEGEDNG